jgi:RHS repeat-associated protein
VTSEWDYDAQGRLTAQTDPIGTFSFTYDGNTGRTATVTYPNGQTTTYGYFPNSGDHRLEEIHHKKPGGTTLNKFNYTYDVAGNIKTWLRQTDTNPAEVHELEYDRVDQLTAATLKTTGGSPQVLKRYRYAYDPAGNRTADQVDDAVTGASYDNMNRLLGRQPGGAVSFRGEVNEPSTVSIGGQAATVDASGQFAGQAPAPAGTSNVVITATDPSGNERTNTYEVTGSGGSGIFSYDANGNLTSDGPRTYEWDAENRLLAVKDGQSTLASFTYDAEGRRSTKTVAGVTTTFVYNGRAFLEERSSTGSTKRYIYGPGIDRPFALVSGGAVSYDAADHLGSIVRRTDATGEPILSRDYDPWGTPLEGASVAGYAFTGREWDPETGLYYYRARYYDPRAGRFPTEDPIGNAGSRNYYAYAANSPVNYTDATGLKEDSASNKERREKIASTAVKYLDAEDWMTANKKGRFPAGSYKCNLFVCDVAAEAGAPTALPRAWPCPTAGEFAKSSIPNWRFLTDEEEPCPGDIVAYAWGPAEGGYDDASGHVGIVAKPGWISAHTDKPVDTNFPMKPVYQGAKLKFRRYTGE